LTFFSYVVDKSCINGFMDSNTYLSGGVQFFLDGMWRTVLVYLEVVSACKELGASVCRVEELFR